MSVPLIIGVLESLVVIALLAWVIWRRNPGWMVIAAVAGVLLVAMATSGFLLMKNRGQSPSGPTGKVEITSGAGETGCVVNVAGTADLPAGRDAWLILVSSSNEYYAQGGRPIAQGPAAGAWQYPGARISDTWYDQARYTWLVIVVSAEMSERLQSVTASSADRGWVVPAADFPAREEISASKSAAVVLTEHDQCGDQQAGAGS